MREFLRMKLWGRWSRVGIKALVTQAWRPEFEFPDCVKVGVIISYYNPACLLRVRRPAKKQTPPQSGKQAGTQGVH